MLSGDELYIAIGIIGATVMPHNLYLHSALVQSRDVTRSRAGGGRGLPLQPGRLVGGHELRVLRERGDSDRGGGHVLPRTSGRPSSKTPTRCSTACWATWLAPYAFALALLCAGQSSTITGTLAGQITMEGFLRFRIRPWLRRLVTRSLAIIPAVAVILADGRRASTNC